MAGDRDAARHLLPLFFRSRICSVRPALRKSDPGFLDTNDCRCELEAVNPSIEDSHPRYLPCIDYSHSSAGI